MALDRQSTGTLASSGKVGGLSGGNDQRMQARLNAVVNTDKTNRWGDYSYTCVIRNLNQNTAGEGSGPTNYDDDSMNITGRSLHGCIVKGVTIYLRRASSTSTSSTNFVTAKMYKNSTRNYGDLNDIGKPQATDVTIVPSQQIRSIQGVDDDNANALLDSAFIELPISANWVGPGEYWALRFTPPSTTSMGWDEAQITIRFAELHTT